ncbi:type III secretion system outer membrane ring subunit SctC [Desulfovibrio sp. OttesenSCG-928-F20]|nr:type III secretion system outer membrane ring subunit SctC [Desulfovibrio sp. OttesenSCG-928-F20]
MKTQRLALFLVPLLLLLLALPARAAPFSYAAQNEPLPDFLCTYAASQSKGCSVSAKISGNITGNLEFRTSEAFFSFLENSRDIITYQDSGTIYYYDRSEMESAMLPLNRISVSKISATLREMQAYDPRYPLRAINNGRMLRLQAPPVYVNLVTSLVSDLEDSFAATKGTRFFRLQHAWADDIELNFMNKSTVVPGVATLLRRITNDGASAPAALHGDSGDSNMPGRLKGSGMASRTGTQESSRMAREMRRDRRAQEQAVREGGARILADSRLNAVIIWDDEELLPFYERLIAELDQPVILVEIRAAIVDVSVDRMRELGVAWSAQSIPGTGQHWGAVGGANVGAGSSAVDFNSNQGYGLNLTTIYRDGLDMFMARVHALEEDGDASVLSRPAVLTLDNIQASMEATNTYYISVAGQEEVDLFDVTYGTILRVTPHVITDAYSGRSSIKLTVHVEDGGSRESGSSPDQHPIISRTVVNTQALVGENQALVIGGHYYETVVSGESGIPLLKDIPLVGALFKTQTDSYRKQERLFIISPRLITPESLMQQTNQFGEMFQRTMMTPPTTTIERTTGGCARQRRVSTKPMPMPMPAAEGPQQSSPYPDPIPGQVSPAGQRPAAPGLGAPQQNAARI